MDLTQNPSSMLPSLPTYQWGCYIRLASEGITWPNFLMDWKLIRHFILWTCPWRLILLGKWSAGKPCNAFSRYAGQAGWVASLTESANKGMFRDGNSMFPAFKRCWIFLKGAGFCSGSLLWWPIPPAESCCRDTQMLPCHFMCCGTPFSIDCPNSRIMWFFSLSSFLPFLLWHLYVLTHLHYRCWI
jgi:hypothetical protein